MEDESEGFWPFFINMLYIIVYSTGLMAFSPIGLAKGMIKAIKNSNLLPEG